MEAKNIINSKFGGFEYMDNNKEMIEGLVSQILDDYHDDKIINQQALFSQPDKEAVCDLLSKLIKIMYPGYFKGTSFRYYNLDSQIAVLLEDIMYNLRKQVVLALPQNPKYRSLSHHELVNMSEKISNDFFKRIPKIRALVETDVAAFLTETLQHTITMRLSFAIRDFLPSLQTV